MEQLLELDKSLFLYLNNLGSDTWDLLWLIITNKLSSIPLYVILLVLLYRSFGWKVTLITLVVVALMITCTDQLANLFKHGFERRRPCHLDVLGEYARVVAPRCGRFGFFSAHAASAMALAIFIGKLLKQHYRFLLYILIFWAIIVGYSRIYVGVHYPLDVLAGFGIGVIIALLALKLHNLLIYKFL